MSPRDPISRITSQRVSGRELVIAALTGAVMGVVSYYVIRHVEAYVREGVDSTLPGA